MFWGSSEEAFEKGQAVIIHSLIGTPELNGERGKCERWIEDTGQWSIRLDSGELKIVKSSNLQEAPQADASTVSTASANRVSLAGQKVEKVSEEDAAYQAIDAALQLFDLCRPAEDWTISGADLEQALQSHLGREDDLSRVRSLLHEHQSTGDRYNFLTYWQTVDRFFEEAGAFPKCSGNVGEVISTIQGMRKFRDGVLEIHRRDCTQDTVSASLLLRLLQGIRASAEDSAYWDEVMQAIPDEDGFGLTMPEVAEAVYIWLKDFTKCDPDVAEQVCACGGTFGEDAEFCLRCGRARPRDVAQEPEQPTRIEAAIHDQAVPVELPQTECEQSTPANQDVFAPKNRKKTLTKQLTGSLQFDGSAGLALHMQRCTELTELIGQRTPQDEEVVHDAVARLADLHKIFERAWQDSQVESSSLRKSLDALIEKKEAMQREFDKSLRHAGDLDHRFELVERQRDEHSLRAGTLETQVSELIEQRDVLSAELRKFRADTESYQREKTEVHRKHMQLQSRMHHLEKNADTAEGQVSWMRRELEKLRQQLRALRRAAHSYASCSQEAEEVASILHTASCLVSEDVKDNAPLDKNTSMDNGAELSREIEELEKQLGLQQVQLQRLRQVRDDLLKAHESWGAKANEDNCSPRELQVHRRCSFLGAQLQALLQHARELECLLDDRCKEPDAKRIMSVQHVADESKKAFGEFEQNLHTLEVQKQAVEKELHRLQTRVAEQENQLRIVQRHRDQLLVETSSQKGTADETRSTVSSSSGSAVTRNSGADPSFLFGSAKPAEGQLRHSPKAPETVEKSAKTLLHAKKIGGKEQWQRSAASSSKSQAHGFHAHVTKGGGLAAPEMGSPGGSSNSQTFNFSAPSSSQTREIREKAEHGEARNRERSRAKEEKAARREKRDRRNKEEKGSLKEAEGACDQQ